MNVKKGIIALFIFPLFIISMMPLSVHADTTTNTAPFLGFNVQITGYGENMSSIQIPKINFSYAGNTVPSGYISGKLNCTSPSTPTSSAPCDIFSLTNNNGGYSDLQGLKVVFPLQSYLLDANGNAIINHQSYFFIDYEFILDSDYKGYVVITSSDNVSHTIYVNGNNFHYETFTQDPANPLTFTISDYNFIKSERMNWDIPVESYGVVYNAMQTAGQYVTDVVPYNNYNYPVFKFLDTNKHDFFQFYSWQNINTRVIFICLNRNLYSVSQFLSFFELHAYNGGGFELTSEYIKNYKVLAMTSTYTVISFDVLLTNLSSQISFRSMNINSVIPIYCSRIDYMNVSTDFALKYGLTNRMLDDIDHIANGTTNSNASVSSADQQNDTFKEQSNDLITQEEEFTSNMKQNLQQIDTSFTFNNFGNKFMSSAVWVRDQYDHMITNTPFGTLVTFSLLLGLGLLIIGRTVNK